MMLVTFKNDGTGDKHTGNYDVAVSINGFGLAVTRIENHRRADGWLALLRALVEKLEREQC